MTPAQNRVLVLIEPEGSRPAVLASRAEMTRQSMHELLVSMTEAGLIELRPDPHDRRAKLAVLTAAGWDAERVGRVLEHYEGQTDDEAGAEDAAGFTAMEIPVDLVPVIREMIAKRRTA